jgi:carbohydrate-selective porin OprB
MNVRRSLIVAVGVAALAAPSAAGAAPGGNGKGKQKDKKNPNVQYVFKGTYAGDSAVDVTHGNSHVRKGNLDDQTAQFDLTSAKLVVGDTNADAVIDLNDVVVGDAVVVKARLPKRDPGDQPFEARQLVDQTQPAPEEDDAA